MDADDVTLGESMIPYLGWLLITCYGHIIALIVCFYSFCHYENVQGQESWSSQTLALMSPIRNKSSTYGNLLIEVSSCS